jgi:hypothetical protein
MGRIIGKYCVFFLTVFLVAVSSAAEVEKCDVTRGVAVLPDFFARALILQEVFRKTGRCSPPVIGCH